MSSLRKIIYHVTKLILMIRWCFRLGSPLVVTVHARGVMLPPTALQRRPLISMHADRSAAPGPMSSVQCPVQGKPAWAQRQQRGEVNAGTGTDAQHPHVFLPKSKRAYTRTQQEQQKTGNGGPEGSTSVFPPCQNIDRFRFSINNFDKIYIKKY